MLKNMIMTVIAMSITVFAFAGGHGERYVMVTHGEGKDPFWPVVQKGGEDAARAIGAKFEYIYNPSADMADMASSIQAAAATQPDGMVISLPDPDALGCSGNHYEFRIGILCKPWSSNACWTTRKTCRSICRKKSKK